MQEDFHYYATYCAAYMAGYSHDESMVICSSAQFVDYCSRTYLQKAQAPREAATTQLQLEMMDARVDKAGIKDITSIWASFHFLPGNLETKIKRGSKRYKRRYRLICHPNSNLLEETVNLAKGQSLEAFGLAMHVLADTWAHRYFAGIPSLVINNTNAHFFELLPTEDGRFVERKVNFNHNPASPDDPEKGNYTNTIFRGDERSVMNLGHGRAGHLPDYSFMRYKYLPAWADYEEILKDNPSDYMHAFCQMVYALKCLRDPQAEFYKEQYDWGTVEPYKVQIKTILEKRQLSASEDWKALGESLSGCSIPDFDMEIFAEEYLQAEENQKEQTFLGRFITAAIGQKQMVGNRIMEQEEKR